MRARRRSGCESAHAGGRGHARPRADRRRGHGEARPCRPTGSGARRIRTLSARRHGRPSARTGAAGAQARLPLTLGERWAASTISSTLLQSRRTHVVRYTDTPTARSAQPRSVWVRHSILIGYAGLLLTGRWPATPAVDASRPLQTNQLWAWPAGHDVGTRQRCSGVTAAEHRASRSSTRLRVRAGMCEHAAQRKSALPGRL